jgi:hypothetical protein
MSKVELRFMVVPDELQKLAYVPNAIRLRIVDPDGMFAMGLLGDSGRRLAQAGAMWYFEEDLASELIENGIAEKC